MFMFLVKQMAKSVKRILANMIVLLLKLIAQPIQFGKRKLVQKKMMTFLMQPLTDWEIYMLRGT